MGFRDLAGIPPLDLCAGNLHAAEQRRRQRDVACDLDRRRGDRRGQIGETKRHVDRAVDVAVERLLSRMTAGFSDRMTPFALTLSASPAMSA